MATITLATVAMKVAERQVMVEAFEVPKRVGIE